MADALSASDPYLTWTNYPIIYLDQQVRHEHNDIKLK